MARRHFLVSYDIADDKRRTRVFNLLHANGDHAQFSVFLCQLNPAELASLRLELVPLIRANEDQVMILDLGAATDSRSPDMIVLGKSYVPPVRAMIV